LHAFEQRDVALDPGDQRLDPIRWGALACGRVRETQLLQGT
jgi:hypothetical protein